MATFDKDPDSELDYSFDWRPFLGGDTIATYTLAVTGEGLEIVQTGDHAPAMADNIVTFWLKGGTAGVIYSITNRVTSVAGRKEDRTMRIRMRNK